MAQPMSHAIIRWHVRYALLNRERATALARLAAATNVAAQEAGREQVRVLDQRLRALGPDPSGKMG